jgi:hypothetical protein
MMTQVIGYTVECDKGQWQLALYYREHGAKQRRWIADAVSCDHAYHLKTQRERADWKQHCAETGEICMI